MRRHDDGGVRVAAADAGGDTLLVIGSVAGEGGERALDLIEQGAHLRAVVHVPGGQQGGDDPSGAGVQAEVQLPPGRRTLVPCFSFSHSPAPHSFSPVLSTSRCRGSAPALEPGRSTSSVAAQRAVVGDGEVEPEQAYDGADQALRLTQGQPEHGLERQCRQDCQGRVIRFPVDQLCFVVLGHQWNEVRDLMVSRCWAR